MSVKAILRMWVVLAPLGAIVAAFNHVWFWAAMFAAMTVIAPLALYRHRNAPDA